MLIKSADDQSARIALLESLDNSSRLDDRQTAWTRAELQRLRRAIDGARAVARWLDDYLGDSRHYAVLHDLRLAFGDDASQIDHLLIGRAFEFFLVDTQHFGADLSVDEQGAFAVRYGDEPAIGIPSPLERGQAHERMLVKALETLGITGRVSARPTFHHVVLVDAKSTITRPPGIEGAMLMTADQFRGWHERYAEKDNSFASVLTGVLNVRAGETVDAWGRALARLHRPADPLQLPPFMAQQDIEAVPGAAPQAKRKQPRTKGRRRAAAERRELICTTCGTPLSDAEGKLWSSQRDRLGDRPYCSQHQGSVPG
jgi:hypothetical protein